MSLSPIGGYLFALLAYVYVAFNVSSSHYLYRSTSNRHSPLPACFVISSFAGSECITQYFKAQGKARPQKNRKAPLRLACQPVMEKAIKRYNFMLCNHACNASSAIVACGQVQTATNTMFIFDTLWILSSDPHSTYESSAKNIASLMIVILSNGELSPLG